MVLLSIPALCLMPDPAGSEESMKTLLERWELLLAERLREQEKRLLAERLWEQEKRLLAELLRAERLWEQEPWEQKMRLRAERLWEQEERLRAERLWAERSWEAKLLRKEMQCEEDSLPYPKGERFHVNGVSFSVTTSANGGMDMHIASHTIHLPKYSRETDLAYSGYERSINMTKESNSNASLNSTMSKSKSPNAGSEFLPSPFSATPQAGDKGFFPNSGAYHTAATDAVGNHVTKDIFMASMLTEGNYHSGTDLPSSGYPLVILDSQAQANATGLFSVFSSFTIQQENVVLVAANGDKMPAILSGSVSHDRFQLNNVHYIPNAGNRIIVSGSELDKLGYLFGLGAGKCTVIDLRTSQVVGEGHLVNGDYVMDYLRIPPDRVPEALPLPVEPLPEGLM